LEFPAHLGRLAQSRDEGYNFKLAPRYGSGTIALRNLDDPAKYRSTEFAAIAVEEITELKAETFDLLRFRLRWPGIDRPNFAAAGQPGNIGHGWVKELWIDGARDGNRMSFPVHLRSLFDEFAFVNAGVDDNPAHLADLPRRPADAARAAAQGGCRWRLDHLRRAVLHRVAGRGPRLRCIRDPMVLGDRAGGGLGRGQALRLSLGGDVARRLQVHHWRGVWRP